MKNYSNNKISPAHWQANENIEVRNNLASIFYYKKWAMFDETWRKGERHE